jgi:hypothetical protein
MRLALQLYQQEHGALPPLCVRDNRGKPIHSWRALMLPYLESQWFERLDLSQPWNSDNNRTVINDVPPEEWAWFARDLPSQRSPALTHIFASIGPNSIWEDTTGLPKGTTGERGNSILLISLPESTIEPMQPGDVNEDDVRKMVEAGHEVLFIMAGTPHGYGIVTIDSDGLVFPSWQDVLDRRERAR